MRTHQRGTWVGVGTLLLVLVQAMWLAAHFRRPPTIAQRVTGALQTEIENVSRGQTLPTFKVQRLISLGADANARSLRNDMLLHCACASRVDAERNRVPLIRFLLAHGADISARAGDGSTPLIVAVTASKPDIVRVLIANGADVNLRRPEEITTVSALNLANERLNQAMEERWATGLRPEAVRASLLSLRDANRILVMLKAAGAQE